VNDVIIVGSGAAAVHAAFPLVQAGRSVLLLDYGNQDTHYGPLIPAVPFPELRRRDEAQHRYFLGDRFEGIPFGSVRVGAQLTPPRLFISRDTDRLMPVESGTFSPLESLALGGLAAGWGAGVYTFSDADLSEMPLTHADLLPHYRAVGERIGICGAEDDLSPYFGACGPLLPPLDLDPGAAALMERYERRRSRVQAAGLRLGRARMAVCTAPHRGRGPHEYRDMDFWSDGDRSVYRPRWTVDELSRHGNFTYSGRWLVLSFAEKPDGRVEIRARHADSGQEETFTARSLVLAAGTLGTARIVLRSLDRYGTAVPLVCNPYTYLPMLNLGAMGRVGGDRRCSLAQLGAVYLPPGDDGGLLQVYYFSYRSLLAYKLLKESPLPHRQGLRVIRALMPLLGIVGVHHADRPSTGKFCVLEPSREGGADRLRIDYRPAAGEAEEQERRERGLIRAFRLLNCLAFKKVRPGHGSSIHYAGTLPMRRDGGGGDLSCDASGRLRASRAVYIADGSVFPSLPAKGLTFSIMAHADRVGSLLAGRDA
jgi:choline dehydrogenase-like flavoprotein